MMKWLPPSSAWKTGTSHGRKDGARREGLPAADRRIRDAGSRLAGPGLGQDVDLSLLAACRADDRGRRREVGPNMMTGHPGVFAGGDMVPSERTVTVAVGHGKKAARHIDAWLRGGTYAPALKHELASVRQAQQLVLRRRAQDGAAYARSGPSGDRPSKKSCAASTKPTLCMRRAAACRAATASNATTATGCARTTR